MQLAEVRVETVEIPFRRPLVSSAERWESLRAGIVILSTDDGRRALGEFPAPRPDDLGEDVSPRLVSTLTGLELADPVAVEGSLRQIDAWPFVGRAARSAVESALMDLLAQVNRRPLSTFLHAEAVDVVTLNATLGIDEPSVTAAAAVEAVGSGFRALKLKAADEAEGVLAARVDAVRRAVGPHVALRLDFNGSLPRERAADVLAAVAVYDIEYAEQPLAPSAGAEALAHLRWTGPVPVAADEAVRDVGSARVLLETGAVDALVVKPARVGGLRQAEAIIELATTESVPVIVSTLFESGVGLAGAVHLAATAPGPQAHGLATAGLLESDLLIDSLVISDGRMTVPSGPGLGVDLDDDAVARYRVT